MADTPDDEIDTTNYQYVSLIANDIVVLFPKTRMTRDQALLHAAWLVASANPAPGEFERVLAAVQST